MKEENLDRRIRKTRKLLRQCLTELLKEKKIQEITVREIADMADINRGTFYLHYKDVFDLMEQIETELLTELNEVLKHHHAEDLLYKPSVIFTDVYSLVRNNSDMISILLGDNGDLNFLNKLKEIVREKCLRDWVDLFCSKESRSFDAYYSFIVSGCIGMVQHWLNTNMTESPEEMGYLTEQIILKGIRVFEPEKKSG